MITLRDIQLRFGARPIFGGVTGTITARDRIGLVGSNGMGKSTLIRVLMNEQEFDGGAVEKASYVTLGHLPQDGLAVKGRPLRDEAMTAFEDVLDIQRKVDEASARLQELDPNTEEYAETLEVIGALEHHLQDAEAHKLPSRVERVLLGLGFEMSDLERDCGEFSGGWQMRIAMAKLLLREPSLLLLDEPTNHLDLDSLTWLEQYLKGYEGALIIVSHDRAFLDGLTTRTWALSKARLENYNGNYSFFEKESVQRREALKRSAENQQKQIAETERFIERFRAKNTKATQVQSRIKALEKIERIEIEDEEASVAFSLPPAPHCGQVVLELSGVEKRYGDLEIYRNLDLKIERGERIAIVGRNGAGKSTLARILAGVEPIQAGEREVGYQVQVAYFAQHQAEELDPMQDALSIAEAAAPQGQGRRARTLLGAFLFTGDDVFKKVKVLSGGEKNRLALAKMLLQPFNCLILDEPTNHLDMRSKEVLQQALREFNGTLIIVSHDRSFLDPLAEKTLEISRDGARMFAGNISYYLEKVAAEREAEQAVAAQNKYAAGAASNNPGQLSNLRTSEPSNLSPKERRQLVAERNRQLAPLKKKCDKLEADIATMEEEYSELETAMMDPAFFKQGAETKEKMDRYESLKRNIERAYADWESAQEKIAGLES
ncbi:ABC-F family ATP-binding cassette domain-containing protein [Cerasicoccus maritimus]|uniref:ABC-F family ATP-binding cassette domain-containing protein n=1 Tax=Cerasicoccus maritimus TaxID=490089 RepID=UPI002852B8CB|nr:ABC-F family ATP-binding cassette domain-containing protein [Cerasicoccus maritimus]